METWTLNLFALLVLASVLTYEYTDVYRKTLNPRVASIIYAPPTLLAELFPFCVFLFLAGLTIFNVTDKWKSNNNAAKRNTFQTGDNYVKERTAVEEGPRPPLVRPFSYRLKRKKKRKKKKKHKRIHKKVHKEKRTSDDTHNDTTEEPTMKYASSSSPKKADSESGLAPPHMIGPPIPLYDYSKDTAIPLPNIESEKETKGGTTAVSTIDSTRREKLDKPAFTTKITNTTKKPKKAYSKKKIKKVKQINRGKTKSAATKESIKGKKRTTKDGSDKEDGSKSDADHVTSAPTSDHSNDVSDAHSKDKPRVMTTSDRLQTSNDALPPIKLKDKRKAVGMIPGARQFSPSAPPTEPFKAFKQADAAELQRAKHNIGGAAKMFNKLRIEKKEASKDQQDQQSPEKVRKRKGRRVKKLRGLPCTALKPGSKNAEGKVPEKLLEIAQEPDDDHTDAHLTHVEGRGNSERHKEHCNRNSSATKDVVGSQNTNTTETVEIPTIKNPTPKEKSKKPRRRNDSKTS